ncbi:MAG: type III pantothenate kinase, partial [Planctomycetota bacterium]
MILHVPEYDPDAPVIVINVGNSRASLATWQSNELKTPLFVPTTDEGAFEKAFMGHAAECPKGRPAATIIGSVVPAALKRICEFVSDRMGKEALVVGESVPLPMDVDVEDERAIGVDRVCAAAMAYEKIQASFTVVDFGSAVT